jgi:hypothetical protein
MVVVPLRSDDAGPGQVLIGDTEGVAWHQWPLRHVAGNSRSSESPPPYFFLARSDESPGLPRDLTRLTKQPPGDSTLLPLVTTMVLGAGPWSYKRHGRQTA